MTDQRLTQIEALVRANIVTLQGIDAAIVLELLNELKRLKTLLVDDKAAVD